MNSNLHAVHSASLFGGFSSEFLPVHELIDGNKPVSMKVFGRFYLHHIDIGLAIIEKILGENLTITATEEKVLLPTKKIVLQHLTEDYAQIPTFKKWLDAFQLNGKACPKPVPEHALKRKIKDHPLLSKLSPDDIARIEDMIGLGMFTADEHILKHPARFCIFGHALGIHLGVRVLGEKIGDAYTIDVLARYIEAKFGEIPTLLDYMEYVDEEEWMFAPQYDRHDIEETRKRIEQYEADPNAELLPKKETNDEESPYFRPHRNCNLD